MIKDNQNYKTRKIKITMDSSYSLKKKVKFSILGFFFLTNSCLFVNYWGSYTNNMYFLECSLLSFVIKCCPTGCVCHVPCAMCLDGTEGSWSPSWDWRRWLSLHGGNEPRSSAKLTALHWESTQVPRYIILNTQQKGWFHEQLPNYQAI